MINAQREYVWLFASTFIRSFNIGGEGDELIDEVCNSVISVNKITLFHEFSIRDIDITDGLGFGAYIECGMFSRVGHTCWW